MSALRQKLYQDCGSESDGTCKMDGSPSRRVGKDSKKSTSANTNGEKVPSKSERCNLKEQSDTESAWRRATSAIINRLSGPIIPDDDDYDPGTRVDFIADDSTNTNRYEEISSRSAEKMESDCRPKKDDSKRNQTSGHNSQDSNGNRNILTTGNEHCNVLLEKILNANGGKREECSSSSGLNQPNFSPLLSALQCLSANDGDNGNDTILEAVVKVLLEKEKQRLAENEAGSSSSVVHLECLKMIEGLLEKRTIARRRSNEGATNALIGPLLSMIMKNAQNVASSSDDGTGQTGGNRTQSALKDGSETSSASSNKQKKNAMEFTIPQSDQQKRKTVEATVLQERKTVEPTVLQKRTATESKNQNQTTQPNLLQNDKPTHSKDTLKSLGTKSISKDSLKLENCDAKLEVKPNSDTRTIKKEIKLETMSPEREYRRNIIWPPDSFSQPQSPSYDDHGNSSPISMSAAPRNLTVVSPERSSGYKTLSSGIFDPVVGERSYSQADEAPHRDLIRQQMSYDSDYKEDDFGRRIDEDFGGRAYEHTGHYSDEEDHAYGTSIGRQHVGLLDLPSRIDRHVSPTGLRDQTSSHGSWYPLDQDVGYGIGAPAQQGIHHEDDISWTVCYSEQNRRADVGIGNTTPNTGFHYRPVLTFNDDHDHAEYTIGQGLYQQNDFNSGTRCGLLSTPPAPVPSFPFASDSNMNKKTQYKASGKAKPRWNQFNRNTTGTSGRKLPRNDLRFALSANRELPLGDLRMKLPAKRKSTDRDHNGYNCEGNRPSGLQPNDLRRKLPRKGPTQTSQYYDEGSTNRGETSTDEYGVFKQGLNGKHVSSQQHHRQGRFSTTKNTMRGCETLEQMEVTVRLSEEDLSMMEEAMKRKGDDVVKTESDRQLIKSVLSSGQITLESMPIVQRALESMSGKSQRVHELLERGTIQLPSPPKLERNPELEERCRRLRVELANKEYRAITRNVDTHVAKESSLGEIGREIRAINRHLVTLFNMLFTVVGSFVFAYMATQYMYPTGSGAFASRIGIGLITATVVFFADLYFVIRTLDEEAYEKKAKTQ